MTVQVKIDGKIYSGSSVQTTKIDYSPKYGDYTSNMTIDAQWDSESVVIDLGEHGYLFAAWNKGHAYNYQYTKLRIDTDKDTPRNRAKTYAQHLDNVSVIGKSKQLYPDWTPVFLSFDDITDPMSLRSYHIFGTGDIKARHDTRAFQARYGKGARVISAVVENTQEPLTTGKIEDIFDEAFFKDWRSAAFGEPGKDGKCHNKSFKRKYTAYCLTGRKYFIDKWNTVKLYGNREGTPPLAN